MGRASSLRASDAVLWTIERDPRLRSTVLVVGMLDRVPDRAEVERSLERASRAFPRLRQRVVAATLPIGPPQWVTDDQLDLRFHLRWVGGRDLGGPDEVLRVAEPIAMAEFDHARPLWELHLLTGVGPGAAFILKFHHSITDGIGAVRIAAGTVRRPARAGPARGPSAPLADRSGAVELAAAALTERLHGIGALVGSMPAGFTSTVTKAVRHPVRSTADAISLAEAAAKLLQPAGPPRSPLMTGRGLGLELPTLDVPIDDLRATA